MHDPDDLYGEMQDAIAMPVSRWLDEQYASPEPPSKVEGVLDEEWLTWWWNQITADMQGHEVPPQILAIELSAWAAAAKRRDERDQA